MDDITNYLIQKITHVKSGEELELSELLSGNFIESMDLSGPKFIATFTDRYSWLRDEIGVEIGDEVQVRVADYYSRDELDLISRTTSARQWVARRPRSKWM